MSGTKGWLGDSRWSGIGVIVGTLVAIIGIVVTIVIAVNAPPSSSAFFDAMSPSETPDETSDPTGTASPEPKPSATATAQARVPSKLYLKDLDDEAIVQEPHWVWDSEGPATIAGVTYPNSLIYEFQNCSSCTEPLEFLVPSGYERLTGTFGLSDLSRHDDVIDGVVWFTVYDAAGNQISAPQRIEYPEAVPVDIVIAGQPRIRIEMSEGSNKEIFVLGDAALTH